MNASRPPDSVPAALSVEITTPGGCKVRVEGGLDVARLCAFVRGLEA
ncbi:MAG: hypothetical protein WEA77_07190 [Hyphomonas sp.]